MKTLLMFLLMLYATSPAMAQDTEPFEDGAACELHYLSHLRFEITVAYDSLDATARYNGGGSATFSDSTGTCTKTFRSASLDSTLLRFVNRGLLANAVRNGIRVNMKATSDTLTAVSERWKQVPHRHGQ